MADEQQQVVTAGQQALASEQAVVDALRQAFDLEQDALHITRKRRIFATVAPEQVAAVLEHAHAALTFSHLCIITGLDEGSAFGLIYHLSRADGTLLNVRTALPAHRPVHPSVHGLYPTAVLYERELCDLFGIQITGLPAGERYPLPDDWPDGEYPLRKSWSAAPAAEAEVSDVDD